MCVTDLPIVRATRLPQDNHRLGPATFLRHPIAKLLPTRIPTATPLVRRPPAFEMVSMDRFRLGRSFTGTGISTRCPSTTPLGLALGPDSPRADQPGPGTLGHPAEEILTLHALLMPAFSLVQPPRLGHPAASLVARRSPTHPHTWMTSSSNVTGSLCECHSFGGVLEPRYIVGAEPLDQ